MHSRVRHDLSIGVVPSIYAYGSGAYLGARMNRKATYEWMTTNNAPDLDVIPDLLALRSRSRDLIRNAPLATGAVNTVVENVVGTGLVLQCRPDLKALKMNDDQGEAWVETVQREWSLWAETTDCDLTRSQNFYGLQELAILSALSSGDVVAVLPMVENRFCPYSTRVQVIEADRMTNPFGIYDGFTSDDSNGRPLYAGVEADDQGVPLFYYIRNKHPLSREGWTDRSYRRIAAFGDKTGRRNVLHLFRRERPGQTRGVPYLAPVIEQLKMLDRYNEAEVMAAVVASLFTVFVKTEQGEGLAPSPEAGTTGRALSPANLAMGNGAILDLLPGEDVSFANPGRPNAQFDAFTAAVMRQIGVALGLPFEILVKHFTASYSAARAALLEAWKYFRLRRVWIAQGFCQPVYESWLEEAIALGRVKAPGFIADPILRRAYCKSEWIGDNMPQIDPVKEVNAADTRLTIGVSTLEDETLNLTGKNWSDQLKQQQKEAKLRVAAGLIPDPTAVVPPPGNKPVPVVPGEEEIGQGTGQVQPGQQPQKSNGVDRSQ